jgi:hypothetical protein
MTKKIFLRVLRRQLAFVISTYGTLGRIAKEQRGDWLGFSAVAKHIKSFCLH